MGVFGSLPSRVHLRRPVRSRPPLRPRFVLRIKSFVQKQFEPVHCQAQIGELHSRGFVRVTGLHALRGAMETLAQSAVLVRIAQLAEQTANLVRASPGLFDQRQGGSERESPRLGVLEQLALERAALPRAVRVQPARAILAQSRTWLGKASDGHLAAGKRNRQPERFQLPGIIALLEFDEIEKRTIAAKAARAAELFA